MTTTPDALDGVETMRVSLQQALVLIEHDDPVYEDMATEAIRVLMRKLDEHLCRTPRPPLDGPRELIDALVHTLGDDLPNHVRDEMITVQVVLA